MKKINTLPGRVAMDTSVLISALDETKEEPRDLVAKQVFEHVVKSLTLVIASPALAECLLGGHTDLLGLPRVEFVDFDVKASRRMVELLGHRCENVPEGQSRKIAKFDAMIVSAYFTRGNIGAFITGDGGQGKMAKALGIETISIQDVISSDEAQLALDV